jgi:hypothetical protein
MFDGKKVYSIIRSGKLGHTLSEPASPCAASVAVTIFYCSGSVSRPLKAQFLKN